MKMTKREYGEYVKQKAPKTKYFMHIVCAFIIGGAICCLGQGITNLYIYLGYNTEFSKTAGSVTLVFLSALFTGLGLYSKLAAFGGAGTLVPITGFSNAIASPAIEFKSEGFINGVGAKMFIIAGPVILYGTAASVIYGLIVYLFKLY